MRIKSYNEALRIALCAGEDAANRRMRKAGRKAWSEADHAYAVRATEKFLTDLGYDVAGWIARAGAISNMPDDPPPGAKRKRVSSQGRSSLKEPVQLAFAFG